MVFKTNWLMILIALTITVAPLELATAGDKPLNSLENSVSPGGDFSLAWRAPDQEDWPMAELFIADGDGVKIIAPLATPLP